MLRKFIAAALSVAILLTTCAVGAFAYDTSIGSKEYAAKLHIAKVDGMQTTDSRDLYKIDIMFMGNEIQNAQGVVFTLDSDVFELGYINNGVVSTRSAGTTQATEYTSMSNTATREMFVLPAVASMYYDDFEEKYIDGGDHPFAVQAFGFKYDITEDLLYYKVALNTDGGYMYDLGTDDFTTIASVYAVIKKDAEIAADTLKWAEPGVMRGESNSIQINNGVYRYIYKDSGTADPKAVEITDDRALISGLPQDTTDAATPVITVQPSDASYIKDATAAPLTVTASTADEGTLTYEWFKSSTNSTTGGTSVGTDATYTPPTGTLGVTYYYVVVTNTNDSATGAKTATVTSSTAKIEITEDPDIVALNDAKSAVESATYTAVAHAGYATDEAINGYIRSIASIAAGDGISVSVTKTSYTAPVDGTAADADGKGTDGTYKFTVTLTKNGKSVTTGELSLTVTATSFDGITDAQAVAAAKTGVKGGTVNVDYGADQEAKTAAVQAYVNAELATITDAAGVEATVSHKSESTYTVAYTKNGASDSSDIEMTVVEGEDPDIAIVDAAKAAAESATYVDMAQSAVPDTDAIKVQLKASAVSAIANSDVNVEVVEVSYTQATAGDSANVNGTNGSYSFKIKVSKGIRSAETVAKSITITATKYTGVSDVDAVAAAKAGLTSGTVEVPYGADQEAKTAAVQAYVNAELAKISNAAGVTATVSHKNENRYTVALGKGSVTDSVELDMTVNIGVDPAIAIVEAALAAVNGKTYSDMAQSAATSENVVMNAVKAEATTAVNDTRVDISVVEAVYVPAVAGTSATPEGTNGSYSFKLKVSSGDRERTSETKSITITATVFDGITDVQAVAAAKAAITDAEIVVPFGTSDEGKRAAVQKHFDDLMVGAAEGVTVKITPVDGDEYTVELSKNDTVDTKTVSITVSESADPDIAAVAAAKAAAENAVYGDIAQETANTEAAVSAIVRAIAEEAVANSGITVTVNTVGTFTPAEAGSAATTKEGVDGSYKFTVTVTAAKGDPTDTTSEKTVGILATEFNGVLDADAVAAAEAALVDGEVIVPIGADEDEIREAVEDYIDSALVGAAAGVKAEIEDRNGDEYTVGLSKGSVRTTKKLAIKVREADPEKLDVPTGLSFRSGVAEWNKVRHATKYTVRLYADSSVVITVTLTDTSYDFTSELEKDTTYVFTVEAIGDGVVYLNSGESAKSGTYSIRSEEKDEFMSEWERSMMMLRTHRYTITATAGEGGSVTPIGKSEVKFGGGITYTIAPDEGYEIESVLVDGKNVGAVDSYAFRNVTDKHTISAEFKESGWDNPFVDIFETYAYYDAVAFVYENGLFKGVSAKEFAPDTTMTRAMFVTVLGRLAGVDADMYTETSFDDVVSGEWYAPYVEWAASEGIVNGYGNGTFGVDDEITVEQAVVILARYAEYAGIDTDDGTELDDYSDADEVADWAVEQMEWSVGRGIYDGRNGKLEPKAPAKRALIAQLLYAFVDELGE